MDKRGAAPGQTQSFVQAMGFRTMGGRMLLIDANGDGRAFLEITGDPDQREQDSAAAYARLLAGMQPGRSVRFLQIYWPDEVPRAAFLEAIGDWQPGNRGPLDDLRSNFRRFLKHAPLPFHGRTILEIVIKEESDLEWAAGAAGLLVGGGLEARWLDPDAVMELLAHFFAPTLP